MSNIILTGFMGTGKTAVGEEVARRMGRRFVDMDEVIVARAGKSIPEIFAQEGEPAFRQLESRVCADLSAEEDLVIATGGGALVDPQNRHTMARSGTLICLTATPEEILRRVGDTHERPLLNVDDARVRVVELLDQRREAYAAIPWQVETDGRSIEVVAEEVIALAHTLTLRVRHPGGRYPIHIGAGLLERVGHALRAAGAPAGTQVALVTNDVVAPLYADRAERALVTAGFEPFRCVIPDGEQHKRLDTARALYDQFLAHGLDRSGTVAALGGGVSGDIAGFAAASFMRGVRLAQVPTTLLAMTDASVGGKTGVDLPQGKNLVGAFKQPALVLIDPDVLATLDPAEIRAGMAEVIKHTIIDAPELFAELEAAPGEPLSPRHLARSIQVKIDVVEEDPFEGSRRAVLNLGHTTAHGLERVSGYELRHGDAVSIGTVAAAEIAVALGLAEPALARRIEQVLAAWGLPVKSPPFPAEEIWEAMSHDKKKRGKTLRWILPHAIGRVEIHEDVPRAVVLATLRRLGAR